VVLGLLEQHQVKLADNGHHAIKLADSERFDIILMDMHLPGIGGLDIRAQIKTNRKLYN
jgi:CheY-like chemotaxis protein